MSDETSGFCVCVHYVQGEPAGHGFAARSGRIVGDNMCCSITSAADPGVCLYLWGISSSVRGFHGRQAVGNSVSSLRAKPRPLGSEPAQLQRYAVPVGARIATCQGQAAVPATWPV